MSVSVLAQLAALKGASAPVLKAKWRELFETEPPAYNRRFLESRLAYRIQELAYGGLSRQTLDRLQAMAKQYATRDAAERKARPVHRPISGTKLIREWQGVEYCVTVDGRSAFYSVPTTNGIGLTVLFGETMRMHSLQRLRVSTSHTPVNHRRSALI
jgi:Protein of unknown function (DUF2924)